MHTPIRIAIIEDDVPILQMYQIKFESAGFQVATAENGKIGLELVQTFEPDLILLDLLMPEMNGTQMLERLRSEEWGASIPVIILTNVSRDEAPRTLDFLHVDRYIVKAHHTPTQVVDIAQEVIRKYS